VIMIIYKTMPINFDCGEERRAGILVLPYGRYPHIQLPQGTVASCRGLCSFPFSFRPTATHPWRSCDRDGRNVLQQRLLLRIS